MPILFTKFIPKRKVSQSNNKIIIAITGASGSIYAKVLLDKLSKIPQQYKEIGIVLSDNAKEVWKLELDNEDYKSYPFKIWGKSDFMAPFASGSAKYNMMVICPCSMGTLSRIASGMSNDLITRAADVILKERRKLVCVTRDTPLSLIHLNNMKTITEAGGIILPASPSFYSKPKTFEDLAATVADRIIDILGLEQESYRWNDK